VYEFRLALDITPDNIELRRELAYLLLKMEHNPEAEEQFKVLVERAPDDLLSAAQLGFLRLARSDTAGAMPLLERVLKNDDGELADRVRSALRLPQGFKRRADVPRSKVSTEAKMFAEKSFEAGYLKDALKYLTIAHESDPIDFAVMLKLGWTHNMLKEDDSAWQWFNLARQAPDAQIAAQADQAWKNLKPAFQRVRTTAWLFPFFSSRWHDTFTYGQIKTEIRLGRFPLRPYASIRLVGNTRGGIGDVAPQYLSENAFIAGVGLATPSAGGLSAWAEAGTAFSYLGRRGEKPAAGSDYRGGLSFGRAWGRRNEGKGFFLETNDDAVYISRFDNDVLLYSQNRTGFAWRRAHVFWNHNITVDWKQQYWANFVETGPGIRIPIARTLQFQVSALRGAYLMNRGNPRRPNFWDLRAGFWYAVSK
jgi:tetratricopeptide (TPR) repeat protein